MWLWRSPQLVASSGLRSFCSNSTWLDTPTSARHGPKINHQRKPFPAGLVLLCSICILRANSLNIRQTLSWQGMLRQWWHHAGVQATQQDGASSHEFPQNPQPSDLAGRQGCCGNGPHGAGEGHRIGHPLSAHAHRSNHPAMLC